MVSIICNSVQRGGGRGFEAYTDIFINFSNFEI